jgi:PadR family transcriptional regulator PadR
MRNRRREGPAQSPDQPGVRQVRITLPTAAMLRQMLENPAADHYGFALAEATSFPSGTIYPILARLETAGWLASFWEHGDPAELERPRRRMYRFTGAFHGDWNYAVATASPNERDDTPKLEELIYP